MSMCPILCSYTQRERAVTKLTIDFTLNLPDITSSFRLAALVV